MRYPKIYAMLKEAGHSPAKAIEIILDATRGDDHALIWIKTVWKGRSRWINWPITDPYNQDAVLRTGYRGRMW